MKIIELRQRSAKLVADAQAIRVNASTEARSMNSDEVGQVNALLDDSNALDAEVKTLERLEVKERSIESMRGERQIASATNPNVAGDSRTEAQVEADAFRNWLRYGVVADNEAEQRVFGSRRVSTNALLNDDNTPSDIKRAIRAQTVTTSGGGYLIPEGFSGELDTALLAYGGMREAARVITTASGNDLPWPTVNDTAQTGELLGINTQVSEQAVTYGQVNFGAYKYSSKAVLVPVELAQDSGFPMDEHVREILAERLGRITNSHLTTGTGSSQPNGVVTAAVDSTVEFDLSEMNNPASTTQEWINFTLLEHAVDPAYRGMPGCRYMFHDNMLKLVKLQLDSNGRPIFRSASDSPGNVATVNGYPVTINQDVPTPANTAKSVLFGDFNKYIVRIVRPIVMLRLVERYADYHQIGFFAFERLDGNLIDAGTNPIQYADVVT